MSITQTLSRLMAKATEHLLPKAATNPATVADEVDAHIQHTGHVGAPIANVLPEREPTFDGTAERNFTSRVGHRGTPTDAPTPKSYDKRIRGDDGLVDVQHRR